MDEKRSRKNRQYTSDTCGNKKTWLYCSMDGANVCRSARKWSYRRGIGQEWWRLLRGAKWPFDKVLGIYRVYKGKRDNG